MINLETAEFAATLGTEELRRRYPLISAIAFPMRCGPLSDDDAANKFTILEPVEATVDEPLRSSLSRMSSTTEGSSQRVKLLRWSDGTESLVGLSADNRLPPTPILRSAYHHGFGVCQLKAWLASGAGESGRG